MSTTTTEVAHTAVPHDTDIRTWTVCEYELMRTSYACESACAGMFMRVVQSCNMQAL